MTERTVVERLDAEMEDFVGRCLIFPADAWTPNRGRAWVLQHRLNSRQRNSVLKLKTATNCPVWEIKLDIIHACTQEIVADHEFGGGAARERGWNAMVGGCWREIWGLSADDVRFFTLHTEADREHSDLGWNTVAKYAVELRLEDEVVEACRRNLVVWETYFNGICHLGDAMDAE